jgi:CO/xanthine dehydrogenase FAD-binding subunit
VRLGAGVTYAEIERPPLSDLLPGLAQVARTVGSPQIRNAGTVGGNLATGSPAGDTLPMLVALDATVHLASTDGDRALPVEEFVTGVKRTDLRPGEVIRLVEIPRLDGPQEFLKIGTRNAMVISVASVALVVDRAHRQVRCGLGSVLAMPLRAREAEAWVADRVDWTAMAADEGAVAEFAAKVRAAARPIDDHRGTAAYRAHAVGVCAVRALARAFPG